MSRWRALLQLSLARVREFYREPVALFWVYGFPAFLAVALGLAFGSGMPTMPLGADRAPVAVVPDGDSEEARALRDELAAEGVAVQLMPEEPARRQLRDGAVGLVVVAGSRGCDYYFDPERPGSALLRYRVDAVVQRRHASPPAWPTADHTVRAPGDRYIDFLIPGLMGFNILTGGLWGVGFVIVDLRVRQLLKRFLATPMRRSDFLLSIIGSRLVFLFPEMAALVLVGRLGFGTPLRGSLAALALVVLLGGAAFAALGLLLACRTERIETASGLINLLVLPLWMFSGTFFSTERFPAALQPLIRASPLTHLNEALRDVMLDGASVPQIGAHLAVLAAWAVGPFLLGLRWFRWR
jgi:ABC-type multidrug transport system permease subunit